MIVNGQSQTKLNISDRALHYGDGCFTTIAVHHGRAELWPQHFARLKRACERLYIDFTAWDELEAEVNKLICEQHQLVLKIIISRGEGGRGYGVEGVGQASYILSLHSMPQHYQLWQEQGIELGLSPIKLAKQPLLAGIKHLNRLEQVLIKREVEQSVYLDAIVCDTDNMMIETSAGNLFWFRNNHWHTPSLIKSGVEGVMRNLVLEVLKQNSEPAHEILTTIDSLQQADEVFICNSLMRIVPIRSFHSFDDSKQVNFKSSRINSLQEQLNNIIDNGDV
jgi:4-amino-4-deoxychorismate lyase